MRVVMLVEVLVRVVVTVTMGGVPRWLSEGPHDDGGGRRRGVVVRKLVLMRLLLRLRLHRRAQKIIQ